MSIVIIAPEAHSTEVVNILRKLLHPIIVHAVTEIFDYAEIDCVVLWKKSPELLKHFTNLKLVCSLGAGVDHILSNNQLPSNIKIARVGDAGLAGKMSKYVQASILYWEHRFLQYKQYQNINKWHPMKPRELGCIGVMGIGVIGTKVALNLAKLGYTVRGYSQNQKTLQGVDTYAGIEELPAFLKGLDCLVCLLPLTAETRGIVNLSIFRQLNKGAIFINVARGAVLNENDLLEALKDEIISEAILDVFETEPLPSEHPFWQHQKITITPHVASLTDLDKACRQIAQNYLRLQRGEELLFEVDRLKGY